jgi:AraC family transcriptional regulator, regulatory protein of adaptative response / methylated-DNA-[protein]-cysteine methyltransferase
MVRITLAELETPLGPMLAAATESHLVLLEYKHRKTVDDQVARVRRAVPGDYSPGDSPMMARVRAQLDEYFREARREFDLPLLTPGTAFQERVWATLQRIPYGETTSYSRLATSIGRPAAVRAVARANGDNRIAIVIPCHRVIGSDGSLTGYGGGLWRKRKLLELEARTHTLSLFP